MSTTKGILSRYPRDAQELRKAQNKILTCPNCRGEMPEGKKFYTCDDCGYRLAK